MSKKEHRAGSPEKPLSGLGALGYKNYWTLALMRYLHSAPPKPTLEGQLIFLHIWDDSSSHQVPLVPHNRYQQSHIHDHRRHKCHPRAARHDHSGYCVPELGSSISRAVDQIPARSQKWYCAETPAKTQSTKANGRGGRQVKYTIRRSRALRNLLGARQGGALVGGLGKERAPNA